MAGEVSPEEQVRRDIMMEKYWAQVYPEKKEINATIDIAKDGDVALHNLTKIRDGMIRDGKLGEGCDIGKLKEYLDRVPQSSWIKYLEEENEQKPFN